MNFFQDASSSDDLPPKWLKQPSVTSSIISSLAANLKLCLVNQMCVCSQSMCVVLQLMYVAHTARVCVWLSGTSSGGACCCCGLPALFLCSWLRGGLLLLLLDAAAPGCPWTKIMPASACWPGSFCSTYCAGQPSSRPWSTPLSCAPGTFGSSS